MRYTYIIVKKDGTSVSVGATPSPTGLPPDDLTLHLRQGWTPVRETACEHGWLVLLQTDK